MIVALPSLDASQPLPEAPWFEPGARWSARGALVHLVAETAQHAGHADMSAKPSTGQSPWADRTEPDARSCARWKLHLWVDRSIAARAHGGDGRSPGDEEPAPLVAEDATVRVARYCTPRF